MEEHKDLTMTSKLQANTLLNSLSIVNNYEEHFDLELRCGGQSIFCHKMIISISPLIYQCLQDMVDDTESATVILPDFGYHEVKSMVICLYKSLSAESMEDFKCNREIASEFLLTKLLESQSLFEKRKICENFPIKVEDINNSDINENFQDEIINSSGAWMVRLEGHVESAVKNEGLSENENEEIAETDFISGKRAKMGLRRLKKYPKFDKFPKLPREIKRRKPPMDDMAAKKAGKKLIQCSRCEFQTHMERIFREHNKAVHQKIGPASCKMCHETFDSRNMWRHQQNCMKSTICEECGFVSKNRQQFLDHRRTLHIIFKCKFCDETFQGRAKVLAHQTANHKEWIPCSICGKTYPTSSALSLHKKRVHTSNEDKKYKCQYCGKGYADKDKLASHVAYTHTKDKPFKCRFDCGKAFNDYGNRIKHEKIHKK